MLRKLTTKLHRNSDDGAPQYINERGLPSLVHVIHDWQITHGLLLKYREKQSAKSVPIGVSLLPTPYQRRFFLQAQSLQKSYNELYARISGDEIWLLETIGQIAEDDSLISALMGIHLEVKKEGFVQDLTLGVFRSDYMLHRDTDDSGGLSDVLSLKQVEFNSYSCAGGIHANHAAEMHQHLAKTGMFHQYDATISPGDLPSNGTLEGIVSGLAKAHAAYGPPKSDQAKETAILFVVQPFNFNIADERPIEYGLWNHNPPIPAYRAIYRTEVLAHTSLTDSREFLYHPPFRKGLPPLEISVVYMRAGYDPQEFDFPGRAARLHIERSRAIKCPNILCHLAGLKKVQQVLSMEGPSGVEHFISSVDDRERISKTFGHMYPLDDSTELGRKGRALACDPKTAVKYVLKPSREGGGHNIFREAIPPFLERVPKKHWHTYILMELFAPPEQQGQLLTTNGIYEGSVVSELGIFGVCMWKTDPQGGVEILENEEAGWSLKTKAIHVDEMSVVKGYGCFDCPRLT